VEVARGHEPQPSMSTWQVSDGANAGLGSMLTPPGHVSDGANAGQGSVPVPPTRRTEQSMSEESDDARETGELSGEVHSILSSRENLQQGGVKARRDRDDPVATQVEGGPGKGTRGLVEPRALVRSVGITIRQESLGPHHASWNLVPRCMQPVSIVVGALIAKIRPQGCYRTLCYLASPVILCRREMRIALRKVAVMEICDEQIEIMTTGSHVAELAVNMEVILVILMIQGIQVIAKIMEIVVIVTRDNAGERVMFIKGVRDITTETSPGPRDDKTMMMGVRRPSCRWAEGTIYRCCAPRWSMVQQEAVITMLRRCVEESNWTCTMAAHAWRRSWLPSRTLPRTIAGRNETSCFI